MNGLAEFDYLRDAAKKFGTLYLESEFEAFVDAVTAEDLTALGHVYEEIDKRQDAPRLCFQERKPDFHQLRFAQQLGQLFVLFDHLGEQGLPPFSSSRVKYVEAFTKPNWENLPPELHYLIKVAQEYGVYPSESEMWTFLDRASESDMATLVQTAENMRRNGHYRTFLDWLKRFPFPEHQEGWMIYCLIGWMDHAGLKFE